MSHFTVLVVGEDYEELLKPFNENLEVPRHISHTKAQIITRGRKNIESTKVNCYDKWLEDKEGYEENCSNPRHLEYLKNDFPEKLTWTDEQVFTNETKYEEDMDEEGNIWTEYNPQSKWDWYSLGGRWADSLLLKTNDRHKGKKGHPSWTKGDDWKPEAGRADQARFGAIDWEGMVKEKDMEAIGKEWDDNLAGNDIYKPEYYIEKYKTKEEYIRRACAFYTHAVLTADGVWHEAEEMGWWGFTSGTVEDATQWEDLYHKQYIQPRKADDLISIVDCHI